MSVLSTLQEIQLHVSLKKKKKKDQTRRKTSLWDAIGCNAQQHVLQINSAANYSWAHYAVTPSWPQRWDEGCNGSPWHHGYFATAWNLSRGYPTLFTSRSGGITWLLTASYGYNVVAWEKHFTWWKWCSMFFYTVYTAVWINTDYCELKNVFLLQVSSTI